jgi:hypothetical protein
MGEFGRKCNLSVSMFCPLSHITVCSISRAVSRIQAVSQTYNLELTLDVNTEVYPMKVRAARCVPDLVDTLICLETRLVEEILQIVDR